MPLDPTTMLHPPRRELGPGLRQRTAVAALLLLLAPPSGRSLPEHGDESAAGPSPIAQRSPAVTDAILR